MDSTPDVTLLLSDASCGDAVAINRLLPLVYNQLRADAQNKLARERNAGAGLTLSATALVHEAYLKLVGPREIPWQSRGHFYAAAAEAMRRILIDRARAKFGRSTPNGGQTEIDPDSAALLQARAASPRARRTALSLSGLESIEAEDTEENAEALLALDAALAKLEAVDSQAAAVVRLRFYTGLDVASTALALGLSERTVKRDWAFARAWLKTTLENASDDS
jgi:RNA polymerase sigma factor (sigma-70 family)